MISKLKTLTETLNAALEGNRCCPSFTIPIEPKPASRPRVTKWGSFYLKPYADWKREAAVYITAGKLRDRSAGPFIVLVEIFGKKPKTTKRLYPTGDVDNHAKGPLDVLTQVANVWEDDDQVVGLWVTKQYADPGEERTHITIYELSP